MKARGKRAARRPWLACPREIRGLKGRNTHRQLRPFQGWMRLFVFYQGRRAARLPLAFVLRAFGASILQHFWDAEVALGGIGGFGEGEFLAQGAAGLVGAPGVGLFAFGSEAADGGLDVCRVEFV